MGRGGVPCCFPSLAWGDAGASQGTDLPHSLAAVLGIQCSFRMEPKARRLSCSATTHGNCSAATNSCGHDLLGDRVAWIPWAAGKWGTWLDVPGSELSCPPLLSDAPLLCLSRALTSPGADASVVQTPQVWGQAGGMARGVRGSDRATSHPMLGRHPPAPCSPCCSLGLVRPPGIPVRRRGCWRLLPASACTERVSEAQLLCPGFCPMASPWTVHPVQDLTFCAPTAVSAPPVPLAGRSKGSGRQEKLWCCLRAFTKK